MPDFKIGEEVLVDGTHKGTIRDIYTDILRTGIGYETKISFRLLEKPFWYRAFPLERISKLEGKND